MQRNKSNKDRKEHMKQGTENMHHITTKISQNSKYSLCMDSHYSFDVKEEVAEEGFYEKINI